jgi:hypothetical protein
MVLDNVLCLPKDSRLRQALRAGGYQKINQVIGMPLASIKALSFKMKVGNSSSSERLTLSEQDTILALQDFARSMVTTLGRPLCPNDWEGVTEDDFDAHQGSMTNALPTNQSVSNTPPVAPPTHHPMPPPPHLCHPQPHHHLRSPTSDGVSNATNPSSQYLRMRRIGMTGSDDYVLRLQPRGLKTCLTPTTFPPQVIVTCLSNRTST